jgi:hypothetical protein
MQDLLSQISRYHPEDFSAFSRNYFSLIQDPLYFVGIDYCDLAECNYRKKCFIQCVDKSISGFPSSFSITAIDFFYLIESISPNFPRSLIMEAAFSIDNLSASDSVVKYPIKQLAHAVYCYILYHEWLKIIEEFFREVSSLCQCDVLRVRDALRDFESSLPKSICRPPLETLLVTLEKNGVQHRQKEMSYDLFHKMLLNDPLVALALADAVRTRGHFMT